METGTYLTLMVLNLQVSYDRVPFLTPQLGQNTWQALLPYHPHLILDPIKLLLFSNWRIYSTLQLLSWQIQFYTMFPNNTFQTLTAICMIFCPTGMPCFKIPSFWINTQIHIFNLFFTLNHYITNNFSSSDMNYLSSLTKKLAWPVALHYFL